MKTIKKINVRNMNTRNNHPAPNQFIIKTDEGTYFQSYGSIIVFIPITGKIVLDESYYDYSRTTIRYRNDFLEESTKEIRTKIKNGEYIMADLNL